MNHSMNKLLFFLLSIFMFISCEEQINLKSPEITIIDTPGNICSDSAFSIGDKVKIQIFVKNGGSNITYLGVMMDDGSRHSVLDSGFNSSSLHYTRYIQKGPAVREKWIFIVMDKNRNKDSVQIVLTRTSETNYNKIREFSVTLGAQNNDSGSFLSFSKPLVYNLDQAFNNQPDIDLIYYFGQYQATFASPAESEAPLYFTGSRGISNWAIKNETRYDTTLLTPSMFDLATNDSLLLAVFDPVNGRKKAKYLQKDMIISFKTRNGKIGLIKIMSIDGAASGTVKFVVKIQE